MRKGTAGSPAILYRSVSPGLSDHSYLTETGFLTSGEKSTIILFLMDAFAQ
ncbi:MAG: hypothetical protein ABI266_03290 [Ginsengibacter sp.]